MTGPDTRDLIKTTWPIVASIVAAIVGVTLYAAKVDARSTENRALIERVQRWVDGPPALTDRLARMEQNQINMQKTLERIEQHQIDQDKLTMQRRSKLSGL